MAIQRLYFLIKSQLINFSASGESVILIFLILLLNVSCVSHTLREDFRASPIDQGYFTAEIIVNRQHFFGVTSQQADTRQPFLFKVAGIHRGTIKVSSRECQFSEVKSYTNSEEVEFSVPDRGDRCIYAISVAPQFSSKESNKTMWRSLQGLLLLRRSPSVLLRAAQLRAGAFYVLEFSLKERSQIILRGCGFNFTSKQAAGPLSIEIETVDDLGDGLCVIDGFAKSVSGKIVDIALLLSRFKDDFAQLAKPRISITGGNFKVEADSAVSFMSFKGKGKFDNESSYYLSPGILRLYTSKGRYLFCDVKESGAVCFN